MGAPSKIHLVSKAYLSRWAPEGLLIPVDRKYGRQKLKSPAAVAYERDWWSATAPQLNAKCEEACNKLESQVPPLLRRLRQSWPLDHADRAVLAQFTALHVARTEGFAEWFVDAREKSLAKYEDDFSSTELYERFCARARSDAERAKSVLRINKMASLIGWMHWTLVVWDDPIVVTSDQPITPVPILRDGESQEISAMPRSGWSSVMEIRFPLSPREALLGTWHPGNRENGVVRGTWATAVELNAVTRGQARRYYQTPEQEPAMPPAILREPPRSFSPISPSILPGYSMEVALNSERRSQATALVNRLIEDGDDNQLSVAIAKESCAA